MNETDLRASGINEQQAAKLRARLATFVEDWDSPDMAVYDDYETNLKLNRSKANADL